MTSLLVKHADMLITMDSERRQIQDGGLFVRDNAIEQAGPSAELPERADQVIDARGMLILPGLVNTHHHLYQTLTRCTTRWQRWSSALRPSSTSASSTDKCACATDKSSALTCPAGPATQHAQPGFVARK
jgi:cytosine/adenosine deaminase-related metal-dependent hydrolase